MPRSFDPEDIFDRDELADLAARRERLLADSQAVARREAEEAAASKERSRIFTLETNERQRLAEFRFHGVEPPVIDGVQTMSSFHLLTSLGWTVESAFGRRQMVAPAAEPHVRRSRESYDQST